MPESNGYKYAYSVGQIDQVLEKIKDTGRPDKLTTGYMKNTWLLKNAQFSAVLDILKGMQFISSDGSPTDLYAKFQNDSLSKEAIAEGVLNAYPDLFKAYPKAFQLSKDELQGYIKQQTGADSSVISKIYGTIKKLISHGDFNGGQIAPKESNSGSGQRKVNAQNMGSIPITMNIQIVIPSDATPEQYDKIFSSIKKNLMG